MDSCFEGGVRVALSWVSTDSELGVRTIPFYTRPYHAIIYPAISYALLTCTMLREVGARSIGYQRMAFGT